MGQGARDQVTNSKREAHAPWSTMHLPTLRRFWPLMLPEASLVSRKSSQAGICSSERTCPLYIHYKGCKHRKDNLSSSSKQHHWWESHSHGDKVGLSSSSEPKINRLDIAGLASRQHTAACRVPARG